MIYKIKPDQKCKACHGSGEIYDWVDWGSTTISMPSLCECVTEQAPEEFDEMIDEIEIVYTEAGRLLRDGTWQTAEQREIENQLAYQRVAG